MSDIQYVQEEDDKMDLKFCTCKEFVRKEQTKIISFESYLDIHEEDEEDIEL